MTFSGVIFETYIKGTLTEHLYFAGAELQVNVAQDDGEPIYHAKGKVNGYSDGVDQWFNTRIGADDQDYCSDKRQATLQHARLIGSTGWNFKTQTSHWVAIDIDSAVGHKDGHDESKINDIVDRLRTLPYVEVRRSKSGRGIHTYVHIADGVNTNDHGEHTALGKAILAKIGADLHYDLTSVADVAGGNTWLWAREAAPGGFELIQAATEKLPAPEGWQRFIATKSKRKAPALSTRQQKLIAWIDKNGPCEHIAEKGCYNIHTSTLAKAKQTARLKIKGDFETIAGECDDGKPNAYMFPIAESDGGGFRVFRFQDAQEHETWQTSDNGRPYATFDNKPKKVDPTETLVKIGMEHDLFHGSDGRAYATLIYRGRRETFIVAEKSHKQILSLQYQQQTKMVPVAQHLNNATALLAAVAIHDRPQRKMYTRVAGDQHSITLDICDRERRAIHITADGWQIVDESPYAFRRTSSMLPLPIPERGGSIDLLRPFVNVCNEDWPLWLAGLLDSFRPVGPYLVCPFVGAAGSCKSSNLRLRQRFIDPNSGDVRAEPKNMDDLMVAAQNSWLIVYDNISRLSQGMSDALCRLATGGGLGKRQLYTDDAEIVLHAQRPVCINSISDVVKREDLLDRSIIIEVSRPEYRDEQTLKKELDKAAPLIMGALCDIVACGLRNLNSVEFEGVPPRMVDSVRWLTACEAALGMERWTMLRAIEANQKHWNASHAQCSLATEIAKLGAFRGTAAELLKKLGAGDWPQDPAKLSSRLRRLEPALSQLGVTIARGKSNGERIIAIEIAQKPATKETVAA